MQTLRPGFLVSLKTTLTGNVNYVKREIEGEHKTADGALKEVWETERTINDPDEHKRAVEARGKASSAIRGVCARSAFGLLCPEANLSNLEAAIRDANAIADRFNGSASVTRLNVYVIAGRIASDDAEAARAIGSEIRELIEEMESGVRRLDVAAIRDAANRARNVGQMLNPDQQSRVQEAIDAARTIARAIVKAGEATSAEIDAIALRTITEARTAFLDLDMPAGDVQAPDEVARTIEMVPDDPDLPVEERRHHPDCPAVDGGGCRCDGTNLLEPVAPAYAPQFALEL